MVATQTLSQIMYCLCMGDRNVKKVAKREFKAELVLAGDNARPSWSSFSL